MSGTGHESLSIDSSEAKLRADPQPSTIGLPGSSHQDVAVGSVGQ